MTENKDQTRNYSTTCPVASRSHRLCRFEFKHRHLLAAAQIVSSKEPAKSGLALCRAGVSSTSCTDFASLADGSAADTALLQLPPLLLNMYPTYEHF